jgi:hypothetical protein
MRIDTLQQYARLRQELLNERASLEARLGEINKVLGNETQPASTATAEARPSPTRRRGRKPSGRNTMSMREAVLRALSKGPLARKDLVKAVEDVGYAFNTANPLNSIGSILYGKNTPVKSREGKFYLPEGARAGNEADSTAANGRRGRKKRRMSREARAKIAAAQKARWAKRRNA